jgi:hypothetical protein
MNQNDFLKKVKQMCDRGMYVNIACFSCGLIRVDLAGIKGERCRGDDEKGDCVEALNDAINEWNKNQKGKRDV